MKKVLLILSLVLGVQCALAQTPPGPVPSCAVPTGKVTSGSSVTVKWTAPTANTNGSPIAGAITYNLYSISGSVASLISAGLTTVSSTRSNLNAGSPCYAVTAVVGGIESGLSNTGTILVQDTPNPPGSLTCTLVIPAGGGTATGSCTTQ